MEGDHVYFSRRAQQEREAAMKAPHVSARRAHMQMAERYTELATAIAEQQKSLLHGSAKAS